MARWYAANIDKQKEAIAKWHQENPDRVKAIAQKRRAAKLSVLFEDISPQGIFERDRWVCQLCEEAVNPSLPGNDRLGPTLDHIIPLARGGSHTRENVQLAHWICNIRKGAKVS